MKKCFRRRGAVRALHLLCLFAGAVPTQADVVKGRIVDADTKEPVPEASIAYVREDEYSTVSYGLMTDSLGRFTAPPMRGVCTLKISMFGYNPRNKRVMNPSDSPKDTLDVGDIEIKLSPYMLEMVEVGARTRRFTVKGDTIVFHPEAFHLQEGARLDELILQLPGVQVDEGGQLTWNGKPVRITMGGESLFGGDDLVGQLPAEAVKDIKAYNKVSEFSERTGRDDGTEDMVLDLTIKPGFLDRWYGDVTAGYETPKQYNAELQMNRLSETDPVLVFVNANNTNVQKRRSMRGGSAMYYNGGHGQEQGGAGGYQHSWKRQEGRHELPSYWNVSGGVVHDDRWSTNGSEALNYLPGKAANSVTTEARRRTHEVNPYVRADLWWKKDTLNTFLARISADHTRNRSASTTDTEQRDALLSPSVPAPAPVSLQSVRDNGVARHTTLDANAGWTHYVKDGSLGASMQVKYKDDWGEQWTDRQLKRPAEGLDSLISQHALSPSSNFSVQGEGHYGTWLTERWLVNLSYQADYQRSLRLRAFETDGVADAADSYRDLYRLFSHRLNLSSTVNLGPLQLMPALSVRLRRETQAYRRGLLDTTAVRRRPLIDPSLRAEWKLGKTTRLEGGYRYSTSQPQLLQTLAYHDETDPLFIAEGNPALQDTHTHGASANFSTMYSPWQLSLTAGAGYSQTDHETRTALRYDPATGVYTSRPETVRGSRTWDFRVGYDQGIGDYLRLQNNLRVSAGSLYGLLTRQPSDEAWTLNRQDELHPHDRLAVSYDRDGLKVSVFAEIDANRLRFSASPAQNTTLWENNYGASAELTRGRFVFETRLTERTRRGYAVSAMNRNRFVWDGAVTWKILKNKARLKLELDDILNTEDSYESSQTAYQQVTYWHDLRHHYLGLTFTYHLDAKQSK